MFVISVQTWAIGAEICPNLRVYFFGALLVQRYGGKEAKTNKLSLHFPYIRKMQG